WNLRRNLQENRYRQNHTLQRLRPSTPRTASKINDLRIVQDGLQTLWLVHAIISDWLDSTEDL
ncbi:hypothetical protein, partial [Acidovorax sp. SUPP3334]|uniref:hypothetical protein n=1 Tax=Acidovorax sp. SUPP3334 TaxID=2920881 RepID=UPI0024E0647C